MNDRGQRAECVCLAESATETESLRGASWKQNSLCWAGKTLGGKQLPKSMLQLSPPSLCMHPAQKGYLGYVASRTVHANQDNFAKPGAFGEGKHSNTRI